MGKKKTNELQARLDEIGKALAEGRKLKRNPRTGALGYTQAAVAKEVDCTPNLIAKYELGLCAPDLLLLHRLAEFYGLTFQPLLALLLGPDLMAAIVPERKPFRCPKHNRTHKPNARYEKCFQRYVQPSLRA